MQLSPGKLPLLVLFVFAQLATVVNAALPPVSNYIWSSVLLCRCSPNQVDTNIPPGATQAVTTPEQSKDIIVGYACVNWNKGGPCGYIKVGGIPSGCRNFVSQFNNKVSSLIVVQGYKCDFFV
jgi:hypothetical protein